jgi:hypothetical protein
MIRLRGRGLVLYDDFDIRSGLSDRSSGGNVALTAGAALAVSAIVSTMAAMHREIFMAYVAFFPVLRSITMSRPFEYKPNDDPNRNPNQLRK